MDGVSAAASFIAIAQALAAIPKIIDVLNTLVHARRELLQLVNEVSRGPLFQSAAVAECSRWNY